MSWPMVSVALFIAMMAVAVLVIVALGVRDAYRRGFPSLQIAAAHNVSSAQD